MTFHTGQELTVDVDRISNRGNPVAYPVGIHIDDDEKWSHEHIIVPGADVEDVMEVTIMEAYSNHSIAMIPKAPEHYERYKERRDKKRKQRKKKRKKKQKKRKHSVKTDRIISSRNTTDDELTERRKNAMKNLSGHL